MTSTRSITLAITTALFLAMSAPIATAQPSDDDKATASARFQKGVELYKSGDIRAALIEFKRAYKLAPTYHLLFNIGQASAELRDYVDAHRSFTRYLRDGGDKIKAERREMVEREIARLVGYLARLELRIALDGAEISIDDVVVGVSPLSSPILVSAGRRKVVVSREGHARWERSVDLAGEDELTLDVELISLERTEGPRPAPAGTRDAGLGSGFWTLAGFTAVAGIGTGVVGVLALRARSDYEDELARIPNTQAAIDDAADKASRLALITDIGLGLTTVGVVVTVILAIRGGGAEEASSPATAGRDIDVMIGRDGVSLIGRF